MKSDLKRESTFLSFFPLVMPKVLSEKQKAALAAGRAKRRGIPKAYRGASAKPLPKPPKGVKPAAKKRVSKAKSAGTTKKVAAKKKGYKLVGPTGAVRTVPSKEARHEIVAALNRRAGKDKYHLSGTKIVEKKAPSHKSRGIISDQNPGYALHHPNGTLVHFARKEERARFVKLHYGATHKLVGTKLVAKKSKSKKGKPLPAIPSKKSLASPFAAHHGKPLPKPPGKAMKVRYSGAKTKHD
jgi:hypothetical protein